MKTIIILTVFILNQIILPQDNTSIEVIVSPYVPPKLSEWLNNPSIIKVTITSPDSAKVSLQTEIKLRGVRVVWNDREEHVFNIAPGDNYLDGTDFDFNQFDIDPAIRDIVLSTNSLPEGDYQICCTLYLADESSRELEDCSDEFNILYPDPPSLLNPADGEIVNAYPQFTWTPLTNFSPGEEVRYRIKIVPVFEGQNNQDAIDRNPVLVLDSVQNTTYLFNSLSQPFSFFSDAVKFAWQVQAVYLNGLSAAHSEGKSEIFTFNVHIQNPLDIQNIDSKVSLAIASLRSHHSDNEELMRIVDSLESNSRYIFSSINSPDTFYLMSLQIHADLLEEISSSPPETVIVKTSRDINQDFAQKRDVAENENNSPKAFRTIPFDLEIIEIDNVNKKPYMVLAIPWALRHTKKKPTWIADYRNDSVRIKSLVAGIYDLWAVPVREENSRYPSEENNFKVPIGMERYPIYIK